MIGFLEEAPGVRSMARLTIGWMSILATAVVATTCWYVIRGKPEAGVLCGLGGILATIVAKGAVAIINRKSDDDDK